MAYSKNDFYALLFVEIAQGEIVIDGLKILLDSANAILIKPRCINSININRLAKGKIICFSEDFFSLRYNNNTLSQFSFLQRESRSYIRLNEQARESTDILIRLIYKEFTLQKTESKKVIRSYLNIILFELERLYTPFGVIKSKNLRREKIVYFEKLIEQHFQSQKLPSYYAELLNVSTNHLNKICKEETGKTAGELIRKQITIEAQRLLHYTNHSVNEIADKLGFENTSYFITFFKKHIKQTPDQFRKNQDA